MSFLDAFKSSMLEIVEETKKGNGEFVEDLLDRLFTWLDEEIELRSNLKFVNTAVNDINEHLQVVSSRHKAEAGAYYESLKDDKIKRPLIDFYSRYLRALSVEDFPLACKCMFQQIETIASYLLHKRKLIEKMSRDVKFLEKYRSTVRPNKSGGYFVPLFAKLILIGDEYSKEFGKAMIRTEYSSLSNFSYKNKDAYDACYNLRNSDSHGVSFYEDGAEGVSLAEFQDNRNFYLNAPLQLISFLLSVCIELNV